MDPLTWFLVVALHGGGTGCCGARAEIALPSIQCKVTAPATTCTISAYDICKAIATGTAKDDALSPIDCIAKPK